MPINVNACAFNQNLANTYGGALYFVSVSNATISNCTFFGNQVLYDDQGQTNYSAGMGGAIASRESSLLVSDSVFLGNEARVTTGGSKPSPGSAGGGGDIYVTNGVFSMFSSVSTNAAAGYPVDADFKLATTNMTGDGGSILIHGTQGNNPPVVTIINSIFCSSTSYGNGGAISISYDSSPIGRTYAYIAGGDAPTVLGGACLGLISNVVFTNISGGWQGGAISANGRGINLTIQSSLFNDCQAGTTKLEDGKGGAIAICGGIQAPWPPEDNIVLDSCIVTNCSATGNGGGAYVTIRGQLTVQSHSIIQDCWALNNGQNAGAGRDLRQVEGLGGAIHSSAGGEVVLTSSSVLIGNTAIDSGGGLSVKSAIGQLTGPITIENNAAQGDSTYGNGGGVYVTTSFYDSADPNTKNDYAGQGAAELYGDGQISSTSEDVVIQNNNAGRWGGGVYVGSPVTTFLNPQINSTVNLTSLLVQFNTASGTVTNNSVVLSPTQIATESIYIDAPTPTFDYSTITGNSALTDIGIYSLNSETPSTNAVIFTPGSLNLPLLQQ